MKFFLLNICNLFFFNYLYIKTKQKINKMKKKKDASLFHFNLPNELKKYLEQKSTENFMTISQYIVNIISDDRKRNNIIK